MTRMQRWWIAAMVWCACSPPAPSPPIVVIIGPEPSPSPSLSDAPPDDLSRIVALAEACVSRRGDGDIVSDRYYGIAPLGQQRWQVHLREHGPGAGLELELDLARETCDDSRIEPDEPEPLIGARLLLAMATDCAVRRGLVSAPHSVSPTMDYTPGQDVIVHFRGPSIAFNPLTRRCGRASE